MGKLSRCADIKLDDEPPKLRRRDKKATQKADLKEDSQDKLTRSQLASVRKEQILQSALRVFARLGPNRATNQDIAEEAGFSSPALIYHYFTNRKDLLTQVIRRFHPVIRSLSEADTQKLRSHFDLVDRIKKLYFNIINLNSNKEWCAFFKVIFRESLADDKLTLIRIDEADYVYSKINGYLTDLFAEGQRLGFIRCDFPPEQIAHNFGTFLIAKFINNLLSLPPSILDINVYLECFLHGVLTNVSEDK
ncbi:MAG: TetR/AcrR family transcriptional regulator [Candidatus Bruticola sp.]